MSAKLSHNAGKWSSRRSELAGYSVSVYRTDAAGDYVRADVDPEGRKIRLLVEDRSEAICCAMIEKGSVVSELVNGRQNSSPVKKMISSKAAVFRQLPADYVRLVNGHYGISVRKNSGTKKKRHSTGWIFFVFACVCAAAALFLVRRLTGLF